MERKYTEKDIMANRDLHRRINARNFSPIVEISGDVVSAWDVIKALKNKFGEANKALFGNYYKNIVAMNRANGYVADLPVFHKGARRIGDVGFYVDEDGYYFCRVYYVDDADEVVATEDIDNFVKVDGYSTEASRNKKRFLKYLEALSRFASKNPKYEYRWDYRNPMINDFRMGDAFIECHVNPYDLDGAHANLTDPRDSALSMEHITNASELQDIVYGSSISLLQSTPVNLNDLDPLVADIVRKEYKLDGPRLNLE